MKTKIGKFIVAFSTLLIMNSCGSNKRHNYSILIDNSRTISNETLDRYISIAQDRILLNMKRYDRLTVSFIDECVLTKSERIFEIDLSKMDFSRGTDGLNHSEDSIKARMKHFLIDSIQPAIRDVIISKRKERGECGSYTDIVNALNEASSMIVNEKSYSNLVGKVRNDVAGRENYEYTNCIIVFSDMVNENRDKSMDFTQMGKYDAEKINEKIEELRTLNKIPDLGGCNVFVYGATSTPDAGAFANQQIENCRTFWQIFFKDAGANLKAYAFDCGKEISDYLMTGKD